MSTEEIVETEIVEDMVEETTEEGSADEGAMMAEETAGETVDFSEASQLDFSDVEDDVECPIELELRVRVLEAVLFISDKPVGFTTLMAAFGEDVKDLRKAHIKEALDLLEENLKTADRGFRLHKVDGSYQLRTAEDLKEYLQNTIKARSFRLTGPSLETLAMIAYKQPCTKAQVDEIRGVDSSHLVRALMDRGLLSFAGRSELPGKPMFYKTTSKFLEVFGLRNIKELPSLSEIEALLPDGIGGEEDEEKETLAELAGKLKEDYDGSYSVGEEELGKINSQLASISTETDFFEQEKIKEKERKEFEKAENIREALMVGEEISTRDQNWLVRFDDKLKAAEEAKNAPQVEEERGESLEAAESPIEGPDGEITEEFSLDPGEEFVELTEEELEAAELGVAEVEDELESNKENVEAVAISEQSEEEPVILEMMAESEDGQAEADQAEAEADKLIASAEVEDEVSEMEADSSEDSFDEGFEDLSPEMDI